MDKLFGKLTKLVAILFGVPIAILTLAVVLYATSDGFKSFMDGIVHTSRNGQIKADDYNPMDNPDVKIKDIAGVKNPSVSVEKVFDERFDGEAYKVSGMKMDYYIYREAYENGEADGYREYEKTVNDFIYAVVIEKDAEQAKNYITKADTRALEAHENADEAYENLSKGIDINVREASMVEGQVQGVTYLITMAKQAEINGVEIMYVSLAYEIDYGYDRIRRAPTLFMQKVNGDWKIFSST